MVTLGFDGGEWERRAYTRSGRALDALTAPLLFRSKSGFDYHGPIGLESDGATGGMFSALAPEAPRAYFLHDLLCQVLGFSSRQAAALLHEALPYDGVGPIRAWFVWAFVRIKGMLREPVFWGQPALTPIEEGGIVYDYAELARERVEQRR